MLTAGAGRVDTIFNKVTIRQQVAQEMFRGAETHADRKVMGSTP